MRISDWSSDVCSSDLAAELLRGTAQQVDSRSCVRAQANQQPEPHVTLRGTRRYRAVVYASGVPGEWSRDETDGLPWRQRSEERRDGNEGVSTCRTRWSSYN